MADIAEKVLEEAAKKEALYKPVDVKKDLDLEYDLGNLLAVDPNPLDPVKIRDDCRDEYLKELARDNTQLLINELFKLPTERREEVIVAVLPAGTTPIPREKPPPKPKPPTKWSQFARQKGIKPRKKEKLVWDEEIKDWVPRYGYKHAQVEKQKNWVVEIPDHKDPFEDYHAKIKKEKKERIAKNEFQRLRNIGRNRKINVAKAALPPVKNPDKAYVSKAVKLAKVSTASVGKFTEKLRDEKRVKVRGPKRKFQSNLGSLKNEREKQMKVLNEMARKRPRLDVNKAANKVIHEEEVRAAKKHRSEKKKKGGGGGNKRKGGGKRKRR